MLCDKDESNPWVCKWVNLQGFEVSIVKFILAMRWRWCGLCRYIVCVTLFKFIMYPLLSLVRWFIFYPKSVASLILTRPNLDYSRTTDFEVVDTHSVRGLWDLLECDYIKDVGWYDFVGKTRKRTKLYGFKLTLKHAKEHLTDLVTSEIFEILQYFLGLTVWCQPKISGTNSGNLLRINSAPWNRLSCEDGFV